MSVKQVDIAIIGAGAAGLFAAIFAARSAPEGTRVVAFDGAKKLGAKILIAGGGRCNVTHDVVHPADYAGGTSAGVKRVLKSYTVEDTIAFFRERGVELKREDTGKLFPTTDRARSVLNALLEAAYESGAKLLTEHRVSGVTVTDDGFLVTTSQGDFTARRVVLCTGGLALPKTGSDGSGYTLAQSLGHTVTDTWPALVPLILSTSASGPHWLTSLKGVALEVQLTLTLATGKVVRRQAGSMLFTHFGLSGPAAMDISRHFHGHFDRPDSLTLNVNLLPGRTFETVEADLMDQTRSAPRRAVVQALRVLAGEAIPERLATALVHHGADLDAALPLSQLPKDGRRRLVRALTALPLAVVADRGYEYAEVTAGGVPLGEVTLKTMESRVCPGLHLAGEVLDVDGRIGGYNFQWAWATGHLAGTACGLQPAWT